ncbi:unnamed protein product [Rhizophagus irregularis]|nr:unnamed protein product [Rhizophagus irregularis]
MNLILMIMKEDISRTHTEEAMHAKSKSQSISSPENENTSLIHNNVDDKSQQYNDDEVSSNLYDEDYCELSEKVKHLDMNDALIQNIFLEVLHQCQSKDLESEKSIMDLNFLIE